MHASVLIELVIKQRVCTKMMHQVYTMPTEPESRMIAQQTQNTGEEGHVMKNDNFMYAYLSHFDL